ncbi:unnamed protein product [Arabidopsis thaliana]|uniref:Signal peptidase complex subunit 1 n=1 Tax=Arabidopsis thaliana TaxID=3702 RepID=A0A7G2F7G8_ARATH|nr:unnamed protein product [Arabidopsis thaliana]
MGSQIRPIEYKIRLVRYVRYIKLVAPVKLSGSVLTEILESSSSSVKKNPEFLQRFENRLHFLDMDWQGQKLAEQLMQILLLIAAVVSFVVGYTTASFRMMMLIYAGGVVLTTLITIPNWPCFNRHHLKWLDPSEAEKHPKPQVVVVSSKKKSSSKK